MKNFLGKEEEEEEELAAEMEGEEWLPLPPNPKP